MVHRKVGIAAIYGALIVAVFAAPVCLAGGSARPKPNARPDAKVIGHLELQSRRITLKSGGLFTIRSKDGKVLAENATMAELRALDPVLQEKLERIMAGRSGGVTWAGR